MFRLNYKGQFQKYVELINVPENIYEKVKYQLSPYIIEEDFIADYKIVVNKGIENTYYTKNNELYIEYQEDKYLLKTLRRSIRDILYEDYLKNGYTKMHCASVKDMEDTYLIIGPKKSGKTSTALGLCCYCDFSIIDGDLTLLKDNQVIGWATPIGTRKKTSEILNIGKHDEEGLKWLWPEDYQKMGYKIALNGEIKKVIINKYEFDKENINFRKITSFEEKKKIFLDNIHYEEIDKENYWNLEKTDIRKCQNSILSDAVMNTEMIECTSNGLSMDNIKKLYKELKK